MPSTKLTRLHMCLKPSFRMYFNIMDKIARQHFEKWLKDAAVNPDPQPLMMTIRNLNMETSLRIFCGSHLPHHVTQEIGDKYWQIMVALELVNFPLAIPGTKVYRAIQARKVAMKWFELAASRSKMAMAQGIEPECMLDEWVNILADPTYKDRREFSDHEMAMVILSFLFASQDAMSSGLIYGFQHLADNPDILAKIRREQEQVRGGDYDKSLTLEMWDEMPYLKVFVKESLRVKPPVTMVRFPLFIGIRMLMICWFRCLTRQQKRCQLRATIPFRRTAWSFPLYIPRSTTPKFSPIPTPSYLSDGLIPTVLPTLTPRTISFLAAVPINVLA
jgi:cytochrome P450